MGCSTIMLRVYQVRLQYFEGVDRAKGCTSTTMPNFLLLSERDPEAVKFRKHLTDIRTATPGEILAARRLHKDVQRKQNSEMW